jgi:drug/metabolite transporter (DMT)-like permease
MRITVVTCLLFVAVWARSVGNPGARDLLPLAAIGVFDAAANVAFGMATALGMLATVSVLAALYPVVTAVLAAIVLRERLKPVQYIGVTGAILGVVMISAGA